MSKVVLNMFENRLFFFFLFKMIILKLPSYISSSFSSKLNTPKRINDNIKRAKCDFIEQNC